MRKRPADPLPANEEDAGPGGWWQAGAAAPPPGWVGGPRRLRANLVRARRDQLVARLAGAGGRPVGRFGEGGVPHIRVEAGPRVAVCILPAAAPTGGGPAEGPCGCLRWWRAVAEGPGLGRAVAGVASPPGVVVVALPDATRAADVASVGGALVLCLPTAALAQEASAAVPAALATDAPPAVLAAALREEGGCVVGFCAPPAAVLCDSAPWDGAGLDCRLRECFLPAPPGPGPWDWLHDGAEVRTTGGCPALVARCLAPRAPPPDAPAPPEGPWPCLCGCGTVGVPALAVPPGVPVTARLLDLVDDACAGAGVPELLVLAPPEAAQEPWIGPCRAALVVARAGPPVGAAGRWTAEPCPRCLAAGPAAAFAFADALQAAVERAPYTAGQALESRLPRNRVVAGWLRFGCAVGPLRPERVELRPGAAVEVRRVLVDATLTRQPGRPHRLVLVDARAHRADPELWRLIKENVPVPDGGSLGILWHGGELQPGLREGSTLRLA